MPSTPPVAPDLRRALAYVRPYWRRLLPVVLLTLGSTVLSLTQPFLSKVLVDNALLGRDMRALVWTVVGFLALTVASLAANVVSGLRYTRVSTEILFDMRRDVFRHLQRLSPRYFAGTPLGQIASRINGDIAEVQRVASEVTLSWLGQVVYLVGSVVMLIVLDVRLFLVGLLALPAAVWALVVYRRRLETAVAEVRDRSAHVGTYLIEALQGMKLLVAHNAQQRSEAEFRSRNDGFVTALMGMRRLTYLSGGLPSVLLSAGSAAVFLYGGWRVISGAISVGTLVAFAAYQMRLLGPVQGLMGLYTSVATAKVSLRRVNEILDAPVDVAEPTHAVPRPRPEGRLEFRKVAYAFDRGVVLDDVSFEVAARSCVALVGASGGGKSTIADLLVRHVDPQRGAILLDGEDLRTYSLSAIRTAVLAVETEPFVFHATLAHNLRVAAPEASDAQCRTALDMVGLGGWLAAAPNGLGTMLGERGKALSSGERQRLALARAYLADPSVLILDEATSALDPATEQTVFGGMASWLRARTVVLITHRRNVAALAHRAIVLDGGRVVEDGTPASLALGAGEWARLFASTPTAG